MYFVRFICVVSVLYVLYVLFMLSVLSVYFDMCGLEMCCMSCVCNVFLVVRCK